MNFDSILTMRHELLLITAVLVLLIAEISSAKRETLIWLGLISMGVLTLIGFLPAVFGTLFGGMYNSSPTIVLMKNVLNIGTFIVFFQAADWLRKPENEHKTAEFFMLILSTLTGMSFMLSAGDFLMFYLGLELASIPVAALAAFDRFKSKSAEAGVKFILNSALSSGILLYGISMIYGTTGSIYFDEVLPKINGQALQILGLVFFVAGMGFKISLVPFHLWTADVYEGAPINVTSYLSVVSKGAAAMVFTTILFKVFATLSIYWVDLLMILSILTITIGNLFAIRQQNMKRFLAFSSIAQAGFILLGVIAGSSMGMASVIYFVLIYIFSNLAAFGVVSVVYDKTGLENMDDYNGFYKTNPLLSLTMMLAMFSLAGIPPVAGFFGKTFLFTSGILKGQYVLVTIALINTIVSLYYYLLVVKAMFINKSDKPIEWFKTSTTSRIALLISVFGMLALGFISPLWEYIMKISFGV